MLAIAGLELSRLLASACGLQGGMVMMDEQAASPLATTTARAQRAGGAHFLGKTEHHALVADDATLRALTGRTDGHIRLLIQVELIDGNPVRQTRLGRSICGRRPHQINAPLGTGSQIGAADIARIRQLLARRQITCCQTCLDVVQGFIVRFDTAGDGDIRDQMGQPFVIRLRDLHFVTNPALLSLLAVARFRVVGCNNLGLAVVRAGCFEDHLSFDHLELLLPDGGQHLHLRELTQVRRRALRLQPFQQPLPILTDFGRQRRPLILAQLRRDATLTVASFPGRWYALLRPVRVVLQHSPQRQPQCLYHQLQTVEITHLGQDGHTIATLPPTPLDQAHCLQLLQQLLEDPGFGSVLYQPIPKLTQHAKVKTRVIQGQVQRILPVNPYPQRFSRRSIRQVLHILKGGHEGQNDGRNGRLPFSRIQFDKVRLIILLIQPIPNQAIGTVCRQKAGPDMCQLFRHWAWRLRFKRHNILPHSNCHMNPGCGKVYHNQLSKPTVSSEVRCI